MRLPVPLRLQLRPGAAAAGPGYRQGQSPGPRIREYFYYIDHQGQLFLDDTKVKNFITCFKDVRFLAFFFKQLQPNRSGRYETQFPFVSLCGRERNFLRCDDRPVVFTEILPGTGADTERLLSYCGAGDRLTIPFQPQNLVVSPRNGRLYHPAPTQVGGVGLVRSALALEWDPCFEYELGPAQPPTHFNWEGRRYRLTGELLPLLHGGESADVTVTPCQG
ncbi:hypothetical protein Q9966_013196 [Columba livia]|nr:hypothetical protein Q9966_013196 [Columba livia]